jgi:hypothetical protein
MAASLVPAAPHRLRDPALPTLGSRLPL